MLEPIVIETTVDATPDVAFDAFVARINDWWPMTSYSLSKGVLSLNPTLGGQITETSADGKQFVWGHVTDIRKPEKIELAWYVGSTAETATQISVTFLPESGGKTKVRLVQFGWEALGAKAMQIRTQNDGGWRQILGACYADFVTRVTKETPHV